MFKSQAYTNARSCLHLSDAALKKKPSITTGKPEFAQWQILYLIQVEGTESAENIAPMANLSRPGVYKNYGRVHLFNNKGSG